MRTFFIFHLLAFKYFNASSPDYEQKIFGPFLRLGLIFYGLSRLYPESLKTTTLASFSFSLNVLLQVMNYNMHYTSHSLRQGTCWSQWSIWSECDKPCGVGFHRRSRTCYNTVSGADCIGDDLELMKCNEQHCSGRFLQAFCFL